MIYLDNNATTLIAKEVQEAINACSQFPLNPSSTHTYGQKAKHLLLSAKQSFAFLLNTHPNEIFFTSGGTESMNMLIRGLYNGKGKILTSHLEHPCIYETIQSMNLPEGNIALIKPKTYGAPQKEDIEKHLLDEPISLMVFSAVYSETGVKIDLNEIAALAEKFNIPLIIDAVALLGKEKFTIPRGVTGMGFSAHKIHGPMGVGAAFISMKTPFKPLIYGGAQQDGKRSGTENIPGIVGFQKALELSYNLFPSSTNHMESLKKSLIEYLRKQKVPIEINGDGPKICNTINIFFEGVSGESLLIALDRQGLCSSLGSACSSGSLQPSKILINMGYPYIRAQNSMRFSWSRYTTLEEMQKASYIIAKTIASLKACYA